MDGILASTSEQKMGAEQINVSISEVNIGAQNNANISDRLNDLVILLLGNSNKLNELLKNIH